MKFCVALISLLLCCTFTLAARDCPTVCPAVHSPIRGVAVVKGERVCCEFSNGCKMSVSACVHNINWRQSGCGYTGISPKCTKWI